jgi:hypothetical protein
MSWTTAYKAALRQLSTPSLYGEVNKLENSVTHLRRSNDELKVHWETEQEDTSWIAPIIAENEQVIAKQVEQVELVKTELLDRDAWTEHGQEKALDGNGTGGDLNITEAEPGHHYNMEEDDRMQVDEDNNGVHL